MTKNFPGGISVIICCYNSAKRIKKTLSALLNQEFDSQILWEIIIVDNNSTDGTAGIAQTIWKDSGSEINFHIVEEKIPGLGIAKKAGTKAASYSILLFCDDDNWLSSNYIQDVFELMNSDSNIAACGGMGIPVFEVEEPYWFYMYSEAFALGSQETNSENGKIFNLYGAGLAIQKQVLEQLYKSGFEAFFKGRTKEKLSSSEDTELTYAFVLMGYKLIYSEDLKFFHFLPKERLTFNYLKKLFIAFGSDGPIRNLYYSNISERYFHKKIGNWNFHLLLSLFRLVKYFMYPPKKYGRSIYFKWNIAYIRQLFLIREDYPQIKKQISSLKDIRNKGSVSGVKSFSIQGENHG